MVLNGHILPESVAVQISSALAEIIVALLHIVLIRVHVAEVAESAVVQIPVAFVIFLVGMPIADIGSEGEEEYIGAADQLTHVILPLLVVRFKLGERNLAVVSVSPAVGGKFPTVIAETLRNFTHLLAVRFDVRIFPLVRRIGAVAEDTVIAGHGNDALGTAIGEVRMLLNELIQNRDEVVGADGNRAVVHDHLIEGLAVRSHNDVLRKAVSVHVLVIVDIVLGENKSGFAGREHDIAPDHLLAAGLGIVDLVGDIMNANQDIALVVHRLHHLLELGLGRHDIVVAVLAIVAVKGLLVVHDERMEEDVRNLLRILTNQGTLDFIVLCDCSLSGFRLCGLFIGFDGGNCGIVVILRCFFSGVRKYLLRRKLCHRGFLDGLIGIRCGCGGPVSLRAT